MEGAPLEKKTTNMNATDKKPLLFPKPCTDTVGAMSIGAAATGLGVDVCGALEGSLHGTKPPPPFPFRICVSECQNSQYLGRQVDKRNHQLRYLTKLLDHGDQHGPNRSIENFLRKTSDIW